MPPGHIAGDLWELSEGETVEGVGGVIKGPQIVRVHEFPEVDLVFSQGLSR